MFKALLEVQWKWTKGAALLATVIAFAVPLASIQTTEVYGGGAGSLVARMQAFGVAYSLLAAGTGLAFALLAWSPDHKGRHVYALSLPVDRSTYAAMRFGAGVLFLAVPAAGVLAGSLVAIGIATIPSGLHAYPVSLTLRFLLASAVAFSIFFAIASSTPKAAGIVLGFLALLLVSAFILSSMGGGYDLLGHAADAIFSTRGALSVFTGRWMLIDA